MTLPYTTPEDVDGDSLTVDVWDEDPAGLFIEPKSVGGCYVHFVDRVPLARAILPDGWETIASDDLDALRRKAVDTLVNAHNASSTDAPGQPTPAWQRQLTATLAVAAEGALDAVAEYLRAKR